MEIVLGVGFVVLVVWAAWRVSKTQSDDKPVASHSRSTPAQPTHAQKMAKIESELRAEIDRSVERDFGRLSAAPDLRRVETKRTPDHIPPLPSNLGIEAWSPRTQQLEVAGEWYRAANLRALFAKHAKVSESGTEIRLPAVLVPDPTNPYDGRAVAVYVGGLHVGYMERPDAKKYHHHIAELPGGELVVTSRQWLRASVDDTWARVTLSLPLPDHLACPNPFGTECVSLPPGSTIQVTKEEDYMEHLVGLLDRYGSEKVVAASLRSVIEKRPRSAVELVAVDIDGEQVGVLSTTQTANFLPLVKRAEAEDRQVFCRASLRGNSLKADVALHARKLHELDESELAQVFASTSA
ncbi:hypothetical protein ACT8ZV_14180 [Nocardioides sp. MAHUQ-72]|uniref:hypothetical protein n=1 Tax=unclassified Nocardioides TaxID=2615069 RepID=UPI003607CAFC